MSLSAVVYAKDLRALAAFYRDVLQLAALEEAPSHIVLSGEGIELVLVRIQPAIAETIRIATPPEIRESTPIKLSFRVPDLERAQANAIAAGGGMRPMAESWTWRGERYLDGFDPEGNVVQFRERANERS